MREIYKYPDIVAFLRSRRLKCVGQLRRYIALSNTLWTIEKKKVTWKTETRLRRVVGKLKFSEQEIQDRKV